MNEGSSERLTWHCDVCGWSNDSKSDKCEKCNCPFDATYEEIQKRKEAYIAYQRALEDQAQKDRNETPFVDVTRTYISKEIEHFGQQQLKLLSSMDKKLESIRNRLTFIAIILITAIAIQILASCLRSGG